MAQNQEKGHIKIRNFENNEQVNYSLILLKGELESRSQCCAQEPYLKIIVENNQRLKRLKAILINKKFKCLIDLRIGNNKIFLTSCCDTTVLNLHHALRDTTYNVLPIYIICARDADKGHYQAPKTVDTSPESAVSRINVVAKLIQCLMAEKLYELGYGRKTFHLENCDVFYSKLTATQTHRMSGEELWRNIGREIITSHLGSKTRKYLGFLSTTRYKGDEFDENVKFTHEYILSLTKGYVALGGAQLALFGTACLYTWPEKIDFIEANFCDETPIDRKKFMDDSCYRGTLGACFATTMGSVVHELCHTFDLGHTEKGIMGRGFDNIQKVFIQQYEEKENSSLITYKPDRCFIRGNNEDSNRYSMPNNSEDEIYFTKSNGAILSYHKWLNSYTPPKRDFSIKFDSISNVVRCTAGLRVIELRHRPTELVLYDWAFPGKVLKYMFQIPKESIKKLKQKSVLLVVEDCVGNILKEEIFIA